MAAHRYGGYILLQIVTGDRVQMRSPELQVGISQSMVRLAASARSGVTFPFQRYRLLQAR
jgi:hypothetical protein